PTAYYVDQSSPNCSDTGSGSQTQPFCHIAPAAKKAMSGETVNVLPGTYAEQVTPANSGQTGAPITFRGSLGSVITGNPYGFRVATKSWIVITGFATRNTTSYGFYITYSSFITVSANDVAYAGQPTSGLTKRGIYLGGTTDSLIAANTVHHNADSGILLDA